MRVTSYSKIQQPQSPFVSRMCMTLFGSLVLIISRECIINLIVELVESCLVPKLGNSFPVS